ncbi:MAG: hypothetical protein LBU34_06010, partial [Planctomycetaceae bacterium]|nr:hypothetical protein [Planctomycetaceae bacterium]
MKTKFSLHIVFVSLVSLLMISTANAEFVCDVFERVDPSVFRVSERNSDWVIADTSKANIDIVCLGEAAENELVLNAVDWINNYVRQITGQKIKIQNKPSVLPALYLGYGEKTKQEFETLSNEFKVEHNLGPQGFVLRQININNKKAMICWSPTVLGCRYGLIEFLRSL